MKCGQALLEYVLTFSALLIVVGAMSWVVVAAHRASARTAVFVSSDYP